MRRVKLYTVMVVPHQGRRLRSFAITRPFLVTMGVLLAALLGAGLLAPRLLMENSWQRASLDSLRQHNSDLTQDIREVDLQLASLRERMEHYEHEARKFALMAGLELAEDLQASGGPDEGEEPESTAPADSLWQELEALSSREERLTRNFQALADAYEEREAYLASIPSISPVERGYLGSSYGYRRDPFTGQRVFHRGQDIVAPTGTPIVAPAAGRVTRAGRSGGLGIAVYLSHGRGVTSRFGHMSRLKVKAGQRVQRGEIIGYVGSTGRSMGSHLHYEILLSGKHIDPREFILEDPVAPLG